MIHRAGPKVPVVMPVRPWLPHYASEQNYCAESGAEEIAVNEQDKALALERAARLLGRDDQASQRALGSLWDEAFENGRLAALDELQDRFCVCMK
jgi:hypothetical protein